MLAREDENTEELLRDLADAAGRAGAGRKKAAGPRARRGSKTTGHAARPGRACPAADLAELIQELTDQMKHAAPSSSSRSPPGCATRSRDLKKELRQMMEATR